MWQQATGWNHSSMALMLDPALKAMDLLQPCTQFTHYYMHGVLQGTGPIVLFHFISAMEEILHIHQFLEGYFAHWVFPKSWKSQHIGSYFSKKKMTSHKQNGKNSCQASECLAMFPIIRHFIHSVAMPKGHKPEACQAFLAMAAFIDQVHDGNQAGPITRTTLLPAVEQAIQTFHQAFPEISLIKKWHWQFHMPDTLQRFGFLPSCFANERKHKPIGALAQALLNQKIFEANLLEQALAQEICHLDTENLFQDGVHLVRPAKAPKKALQTLSSLIGEELKEAMSSQCARINHVECRKDDVVVYQTAGNLRVAEIQLHFLLHGALTTLVKAWQVKEWVPHQKFATCTVLDQNLGFVPTADILVPLICNKSQEEAKVLLPYQIYSNSSWLEKNNRCLQPLLHACLLFF